MRKFAIPAREIPVLFLSSADGRSATLEPRGLWIIGFNGRVDLFVDRKHYLIVDTAKNFAIPKWRIADFAQRDNIEDLDRNSFLAALAA